MQSIGENCATLSWQNRELVQVTCAISSSTDEREWVYSYDGLGHDYNVTINDLLPDTLYSYQIESEGTGSRVGAFKTRPVYAADSVSRILVLGDSGTTGLKSTLHGINQVYSEFDSLLLLGDNAYGSGSEAECNQFIFEPLAYLIKQTPIYSILGNHDGKSMLTYQRLFSFPENGQCGGVVSNSELYYSYNNGPIHIIVLDSFSSDMSSGSKMMTWLENDLSMNNRQWTVVSWHHTAYGFGGHNSDKEDELVAARESFAPILDKHQVDLVLSGHNHCYARTDMIAGHYGSSNSYDNSKHVVQEGPHYVKSDHEGTIYVVLGSSAKAESTSSHPAHVITKSQLGAVVLEADMEALNVQFVNSKGQISDQFDISVGPSLVAMK